MSDPVSVGHAFFAVAPQALDSGFAVDEIGRRITSLCESARARWPTVALDEERFARALGERLPRDQAPIDQALEALHASDVYLAAACETGDDAALEAFDKAFIAGVGRHVARVRAGAAFADEVAQAVRERLFLGGGDDGRPRIADYAGRGALAGWVRVLAVRLALNLVRGAAERLAVDDGSRALGALPAGDDPELEYAKTRHAGEFREALVEALGALPAAQRSLLQLHYGNQLSTPRLGALFGVNHSTIVRRLAAAREALVSAARNRLRDRLRLDGADLDSMMRFVRSRIGDSFLAPK
jgi:RNA polymerase sigma-70 factor (ECF subfamily)